MAHRLHIAARWPAALFAAAVVAALLVTVPTRARALAPGDITTVVGGGAFPVDGTHDALSVNVEPGSTAIGSDGDLFFVDTDKEEVDIVPAVSGTQFGIAMTAGQVYPIAGKGFSANAFTASNVSATSIALSESTQSTGLQIALDSAGDVLISESRDDFSSNPAGTAGWVQEVATSAGTHFGITMTAGFIYTVAGTGAITSSGAGGAATAASFAGPNIGIGVDGAGNLLIASAADNEVYEVPVANGSHYGVTNMLANHVYVVVGNGTAGSTANGSGARTASLTKPGLVTIDAAGDLIISEGDITTAPGPLVRAVPATSKTMFGIAMTANDIYTVAGGSSSFTWTDDVRRATDIQFFGRPRAFADAAGNLFFTNGGNSTQKPDPEVFEIAATSHTDYGTSMTAGYIYPIAGTGTRGYSGDGGPARSAELTAPSFLALNAGRDLFIADTPDPDHRIREVTGSATSAVVIAGTVRYRNGSQTTGVADVLVQACSTITLLCSAAGAATTSTGAYAITVPGPDAYVVTAYPAPQSKTIPLISQTSAPIAVTAKGATGIDFLLAAQTPLPSTVSINGQKGTIPTIYWGSSTPFTVEGCARGTGFVVITGLNEYTAEPALGYVNLTEKPVGSGHFEALIPSMAPVHGDVDMQYYLDCSPPTALVPGSGPTVGGNTVDVNGTGFSGATAVLFGSKPATTFTVLSNTEISAVAPPGAGSVAVSVRTPRGTVTSAALASYTYLSISGVSPASARAAATVTITGTDLSGADALFFGSTPATDWSIDSDTQITATVPAGAGAVDVLVQTSDGGETAAATADRFSYSARASGGSRRDSSVAHTHRPADSGIGGFVANGLSKWQNAANYISKFVNIAVDSCAGSKSLEQAVNTAVQKELADMRQNPTGIVDASIVGLGTGGASYLGTGLLVSAGIIDAAAFAPAVATIALILAVPATLQAVQSAANNPNLQNCLKKFFPKPPPPPKPPKKCKGKKCAPAPQGANGSGLVDPSGTIEDTNGNPIAGATVTLLRSTSTGGPFTALVAGSPLFDPSVNPETTAADGIFHWDVAGGYYEVQATKSGCTEPGNAGQPTVTTPAFPVPPPQLGIVVTMSCSGQPGKPVPAVTGLFAPTGPAAGGTRVTIAGSGFTPSSTVTFGSAAATHVAVLSPTSIQVTAPAGTGTVTVAVKTGGGTSPASASSHYTYQAPVAVHAVSPRTGPANGGTVVTVTGAGFTRGAAVFFGSRPAASVVVSSPTTIRAVAPAGLPGTVDVTVLGAGGSSPTGTADHFGYAAAASTTTLRASANPARGRSKITFTATVAPKSAGGTPSGTVAFKVNGAARSACAHMSLNRHNPDTATCVLSFVGGATDRVTAVYSGDATFAASSSAVLAEKVRKQSTKITLRASANPAKAGARVKFTATVAARSGGGRPTGRVTFTVNGKTKSTCSRVRLNRHGRDVATCVLSFTAGSTHRVRAVYRGDAAFTGASSAVIREKTTKRKGK